LKVRARNGSQVCRDLRSWRFSKYISRNTIPRQPG
jgi:hypothetical protein